MPPPVEGTLFSLPTKAVVLDLRISTISTCVLLVDERFSDGAPMGGALGGEANASFYAQLASHEGNVPWFATFVKDKGHVEF
ncbi:hypothetical protein CMQ_2927 [Grosmannia clavigera kw1407]|uniref:Uncharacterized protein n=1 Tax=Grosmannia clavigera (strain kw1407 / UAMH 11150) TaxID=655863 RepID=F0XGM8_GROCL|nr:uncharacterized protein CMQ_2927 [Grosmannia clavigera kw1407]EFX02998.1 hypothetical protein CMQ_2927 [Grosmannia clavigera kw1407]